MTKKTYLVISVIAAIAAVIGLVSFIGGIRPVNIGAFVFPLLFAVVMYRQYKKK